MWRGIVLDKVGNINSPEVIFSNVNFVENAETAVYLTRESLFNITGVTFNNYYTDINIVYQKGNVGKNKIRGCNFQSSGTGLIAPYLGVRKFAAIVLDDVDEINIGEINQTKNIFSGSRYGIISKNSSIKLLNCDFHDIWDDPNLPLKGGCLLSSSDFDFTDRSIQVGNGSSTGRCNFSNSVSGITGLGEMSYRIERNTFGVGGSTNQLLEYCIRILNSGGKEILIQQENKFYDYTYGVWIENFFKNKNILINGNKFYNAETNFQNFTGTAITAVSSSPVDAVNIEISDNEIGQLNGSSQPRIGIRVVNLQKVKINENKIYYNYSLTPPSNYNIGISLTESNYARLNLNTISNVGTIFPTGSNEFLKGLDITRSTNLCIENSTLTKLGIGMYFTGTCIVNSLFNNTFANYDTAIYLNNADIGAVQGRGLPKNIVLSNRWSRSNSSPSVANIRRVEGVLTSSGIEWYYQVTTNNEFLPTSLNGLIFPFPLSSPSSYSICPPLFRFGLEDEPPYTAIERNAIFGHIVGDSARYPEHYEQEMRLLNRSDLYLTLKNNPEILDLDDEADESFADFYATIQEENIEIFDSVRSLVDYGLYEQGLELVSAIDDTNAIDYNLKECYIIYLNALINDTVFSSSDSSILMEIAIQNPLIGGTGVTMARVMLNLEIYNELLSGERIRNTSTENTSDIKFEVYPVPSHQLLKIKTNANTQNAHLMIHALDGRLLREVNFQPQIDISDLNEGFYLLTLVSIDKTSTVKFVKN
ncbi:MAG: T9SS type A sorting domain-containing protein [Bacteroidetes bacterium]|nr:T9SS type A sorting domain-containing protein [Bacteroidota bacterium]